MTFLVPDWIWQALCRIIDQAILRGKNAWFIHNSILFFQTVWDKMDVFGLKSSYNLTTLQQ